ncbi:MAG: hypothetical protein JOY71_15475 [Acetobacteraceae bacterium]|nr:hypothetical protein [Acetobacteraceae bacterium]
MLIDNAGPPLILERLPLSADGKGSYDEAWLQRLIQDNPACLPIADIEPSLDSFVSICREMPTPHGYVDNLLMTGRGDIALVEAKLFRNAEARRQVLAQALDYATCLFSMNYTEFEKAAISGSYDPRPKPATLYDSLPEGDKLNEAAFADAVSRNLRRGRVLILVVGDGIRSEADALLDGLRVHLRFGFTLALVELALFRMPGPDQRLLVRPSTIAKTVITQRTIIETTMGGMIIRERAEKLSIPETIGSDAYWDALEAKVPGARKALEHLIQLAEPLGVYPEFLKSLSLKWDRGSGKTVNLGNVSKATSIWTDYATAGQVPRDLAQAYVQDLAAIWNCDVHTLPPSSSPKWPNSGGWTLYKDGAPLKLASVQGRLDDWLGPISRFISALKKQDESL